MLSTSLRSGFRHRLIQQLAAKRHSSQPAKSQGFTLIELLVVVIIVAVLAAVALPSFLSQADKAKLASAKSLANAISKECQVFKLNPNDPPYNGAWAAQTASGDDSKVTLVEDTACSADGGQWTATIIGGQYDQQTIVATVNADGAVTIADNTGANAPAP